MCKSLYYSSATAVCVLYNYRPLDATTPVHASARARKRIVLSDSEESLEEQVGAVSAFSEDAGDNEMIFDAPVRGSESNGVKW